MSGRAVAGYIWARIGAVSDAKLAAGAGNPAFHRRKLILGAYWAEREMPLAQAYLNASRGGATTLMAHPADAF